MSIATLSELDQNEVNQFRRDYLNTISNIKRDTIRRNDDLISRMTSALSKNPNTRGDNN